MVPTSKTSTFAVSTELSIIVSTHNQSIKNQPCLWIIHGSGGISSNDDIWKDKALTEGYTVFQVDSYSNRGIFKQHWDRLDEHRIPSDQRAIDQVIAYEFIFNNTHIIPFANLQDSVVVGFSDGGMAAVHLQKTVNPNYWKHSYCLYPGFRAFELNETTAQSHRARQIHLFVGEHDNWTPAKDCTEFQNKTNCQLTIYSDTHHSFSKPGIDHWHENTMRSRTERGVYCKYSEESTKQTMDIVFNENNNSLRT